MTVSGTVGWSEKHPGAWKEERRDVSARLAKPDHRSARAGQVGVDACSLLPSRIDLEQARLDVQAALRQSGTPRSTPILVTIEGVIWDGHHAVRLAAESGETIAVRVVALLAPPSGLTILQLPVR